MFTNSAQKIYIKNVLFGATNTVKNSDKDTKGIQQLWNSI